MTLIQSKLKEFCSTMEVEDEVSKKISITVDEVVSNIILYGYDDSNPHYISLSLKTYPTYFTLEFIDDGKYFDPLEYLKNNVNTRELEQAGGVGLRLVHKLSSEIKYNRIDQKNVLIINIPY